MVNTIASNDTPLVGAFAVRRPRVTDPLGRALVGCYQLSDTLPVDLRRLLDRLDPPNAPD